MVVREGLNDNDVSTTVSSSAWKQKWKSLYWKQTALMVPTSWSPSPCVTLSPWVWLASNRTWQKRGLPFWDQRLWPPFWLLSLALSGGRCSHPGRQRRRQAHLGEVEDRSSLWSIERTVALAVTLMERAWDTPKPGPSCWAAPRFLSHRNCDIINVLFPAAQAWSNLLATIQNKYIQLKENVSSHSRPHNKERHILMLQST